MVNHSNTSVLTVVDTQQHKSTRDKILDTAEQMMARHGIDAVSLNEIVKQSGQRNASALQYHFGNKAGLVQAVFDRHTPAIEACRKELLAQMRGEKDFFGLVRAVVLPLIEVLNNSDGGRNYIRFLSRISQPNLQPDSFEDSRHNHAMIEIMALLHQCFPGMPAKVLEYKVIMTRNLLLHSLADLCCGLDQAPTCSKESTQVFTDTLIDAIVAIFHCPPAVDEA